MIKREESFIIFNGEMVRAILEGRKTQTRRPIKGKVLLYFIDFMTGHADEVPGNTEDLGQIWEGNKIRLYSAEYPEEGSELFDCPYGKIGNRLWVKETWGIDNLNYNCPSKCSIKYYADDSTKDFKRFPLKNRDKYLGQYQRRPSIHMPRWASRITLEITGIRVERVREISVTDCLKEGVHPCRPLDDFGKEINIFKDLWDGIYAKTFPWTENPWVWVITFKVVKQ